MNTEESHVATGPCYYCTRPGALAPQPGQARSCGHAPCPAAPVVVAPAQRPTLRPTAACPDTLQSIHDVHRDPVQRKPYVKSVMRLPPPTREKLRQLWDLQGWISADRESTYCRVCARFSHYTDTLCMNTDEFGEDIPSTPICNYCYQKTYGHLP